MKYFQNVHVARVSYGKQNQRNKATNGIPCKYHWDDDIYHKVKKKKDIILRENTVKSSSTKKL